MTISVKSLKSIPACSSRTIGLLTQSTRIVRSLPRMTRWVFSWPTDGTAFDEPRIMTFGIGASWLKIWECQLDQHRCQIDLDHSGDRQKRHDDANEYTEPVSQGNQEDFAQTLIGLRGNQLRAHLQHGSSCQKYRRKLKYAVGQNPCPKGQQR